VVGLENVMVEELVAASISERATAVATELASARQILFSSGAPTPNLLVPCGQPVGAVTNDPLTKERLISAVEQMQEAASLAAAGDRAGADAVFNGDAHNITHDIDAPLRVSAEQIAIDLCLAVTEIERAMGSAYDGDLVATKAEEAADLLEAGGRALGILQ
jgi:hypothetical protein